MKRGGAGPLFFFNPVEITMTAYTHAPSSPEIAQSCFTQMVDTIQRNRSRVSACAGEGMFDTVKRHLLAMTGEFTAVQLAASVRQERRDVSDQYVYAIISGLKKVNLLNQTDSHPFKYTVEYSPPGNMTIEKVTFSDLRKQSDSSRDVVSPRLRSNEIKAYVKHALELNQTGEPFEISHLLLSVYEEFPNISPEIIRTCVRTILSNNVECRRLRILKYTQAIEGREYSLIQPTVLV